MAEIKNYLVCRHVRAEHSAHLLVFKRGKLCESGRGLAFWFWPLSTSIAEIPVDDRELSFLFHSRSSDFQDVSVQGVVSYRVRSPETAGERIDFSIDLTSGHYKKRPLEQIDALLTEVAQQVAHSWVGSTPIRRALAEGPERLRLLIEEGLRAEDALSTMGIELASVRVSAVKPSADLDKALEMPTREAIQQEADEATFQRRAMAVEKERAIQENELQNQIELARREEGLIEQRGLNERRRMEEQAEAERIAAEAAAKRLKLDAEAQAGRIELIEQAHVHAERERIAIYRDLPVGVMAGLAARELAGKLEKIEHLNIAPELLGPTLLRLLTAGTAKLEA